MQPLAQPINPPTKSVAAVGQPIKFCYTLLFLDETTSLSDSRSVYTPESEENLLQLVMSELGYRRRV
jgi:hypothetical protein